MVTCCPVPVAAWAQSPASMAAAATQPPAMSIGIHVAASGSLPAPPTARSNPVTACMRASLPGKAARGPLSPNAVA